MSEWITDRRPMHEDDGTMVYGPDGNICHWTCIGIGDAWKPIPKCEPYVKPKRYKVKSAEDIGLAAPAGYFCVYDTLLGCKVTSWLPTREAAERIAAIYEEVNAVRATCKHCRSDEYDDYNSVARIDYYCTLEDTDEPLTTLTACVHHTTEDA